MSETNPNGRDHHEISNQIRRGWELKGIRGQHKEENIDRVLELKAANGDYQLPAETEVHEALDQYAKDKQHEYGKRQLEIAKEFVAQAESTETTDAA